MSRALLTLILGTVLTSCASLGVRTEGTSGPIAWHVTELKLEDDRGAYFFTLVLKETQGIPLTFTYRKDTIHAVDITFLQSFDQAIGLRLKPHKERRLPLSVSWGCSAGNCFKPRNVSPRWTINLTGIDDQGNPIKAIINIALPPNPDTYRKP